MIVWPKIPVAPTKYAKGLDSLETECDALEMVRLDEALKRAWTTDAHFLTYQMVDLADGSVADLDDEGQPQMRRVNKIALDALQQYGAGIQTVCIAVDLDFVDKEKEVRWTPELQEKFVELFLRAQMQEPLLNRWHAFYVTDHGARLIYVLERPVPAPASESLIRGLYQAISETVLKPYIDMSVADWTRMFRLSRVAREGKTECFYESELFFLELKTNVAMLDPAEITPVMGSIVHYGRVEPVSSEMPNVDEAKAALMVRSDKTGSPVLSEWLKRTRRALSGRESLAFHEGRWLPEKERQKQRNNNLYFLVSQAIGILAIDKTTTPELVFGFFADATEQLEARTGDDDGRSWLEILWGHIAQIWQKEQAQLAAQDHEREREAARQSSIMVDVVEGMREWCDHPGLLKDDAESITWAQRYMIASYSGGYYVMMPNGWYDQHSVSLTNLISRIRELGMTGMIPIEDEVIVQGQLVKRDRTPHKIVNAHSFLIADCLGVVGGKGSRVQNLGGRSPKLCYRMYGRRTDLKPEYSPECDDFLKVFFGVEHYPKGREWLSHALNFEGGPICALSICAPPGIGKKLLVEGLAECIDTQTVADARELTGRFQSQIMKTGFLVINEGLPNMGRVAGTSDPADAFRVLIAGDTHHVEQKGRPMESIHNPMRILITANNNNILQTLYRHRDLSRFDRESLGERLIHMDLTDAGAVWLQRKGGLSYTGKPGRRWIRGDDGAPSNYIMAKHLLWLYENRLPVPPGQRLLVQGDPNSDVVKDMAINSGGSAEVIEVIIRMIEETRAPKGLHLIDGEVYCTGVGVRDFYNTLRIQQGGGNQMSLARISSVLRGLSDSPEARRIVIDPDRGYAVQAWCIDPGVLIRHADHHGIPFVKRNDIFRIE